MEEQKYKIVRMYFEGWDNKTIKRGLTLEEAQAWCRDPETSSSTAKTKKAVSHFQKYGEWFDGYSEDND